MDGKVTERQDSKSKVAIQQPTGISFPANHVRYHEKHEAHVDNVCILRCTIPKGSTYYEGTHNVYEFYTADAYVSDNIKIENLIVKS